MPTPKEGYWQSGARLPSVTEVLASYNPGGNDGLLWWAVKLALEGQKDPGVPAKLFTVERRRAGDIGTMTHEAIEWDVNGGVFVFSGKEEIVEPAKIAYGGFLKWREGFKFRITHTEVKLISKKYGYGGTLDATGFTEEGLRALWDWKTNSSCREPNLLQLAAYKHLWDENFPDDPIVGGLNLVRFDKVTGKSEHKFYLELDNELGSFLRLLRVHKDNKQTRGKL